MLLFRRFSTIKHWQVADLHILMCLFKVSRPFIFCLIVVMSLSSTVSYAGSREQALRIHARLAGVPPSKAVLDLMEADITQYLLNPLSNKQDALDAANMAMASPHFYSLTLKQFATPWTNIDQTVIAPLNDYSATIMGVVRDEIDFRRILYADILYVGSTSGVPAYSNTNNNHYEALQNAAADLSASLVGGANSQSATTGLPSAATAGVLTSRAAAKAFFIDGTNRAMFRFTLMNHLCTDLEPVKDTSRPPDRIRQDVSRSPGGDSRLFLNNCIGCHSGMDPMTQAFAYYNFQYDVETDPDGDSGQLVYNAAGSTDSVTGTRVQAKYHINANNFPYGFVTPDDRWDNYWRKGPNANLGWGTGAGFSGTGFGNGAKSLGEELANSEAFAQCQVKKVFKAVCFREASSTNDSSQIADMVTIFKAAYNLKSIFAESAIYCMGD